MKKMFVWLLAIVSLMCLSSIAQADVGYDGGFFVKNDADTFRLTFNGRVQPLVYFQKQTGVGGTPTVASFAIRRANVGVKTKIHDKLTAGFTLLHALGFAGQTTFQTVNVDGATVSYEVNPALTVAAGMVGLPLDFISDVSSRWFMLIEAPVTATRDDQLVGITQLRPSFGTPSGLGLNLSGGYWKWFYSAGIVNVSESNWAVNPGWKFSYAAKTGFNILGEVGGSLTDFSYSETPQWQVTAGTMYQGARADDSGSWIKYLWTSSVGTAVRWKGLAFTTEGYYRKTRITTIAGTDLQWARPRYSDVGYYAAAGYYVIPKKLELALQAGQIFRQGPANDSWQAGGGVNYYIFDNNMKLQLAYTMTRFFNDATGQRDNRTHDVGLLLSAQF